MRVLMITAMAAVTIVMKLLILYVVSSLSVVSPTHAEAQSNEADDWYRDQYAPLWKENPWEKFEVVAGYYDETITLHPGDDVPSEIASRPWLEELIENWRLDGWLGSDVARLQYDLLNPSTAAFKVKWRDWYKDGREEHSCAWYLADLKVDSWLFTQYGEIDCEEYGL